MIRMPSRVVRMSARLASDVFARCLSAAIVAALAFVASSVSLAQDARTSDVRVAMDTTKLSNDARAVLRTYAQYMNRRHGLFGETVADKSPLWLESEQTRWPSFDMTSAYLLDSSIPTVQKVEAVSSTRDAEYRITTHFVPREPDASRPEWYNSLTTTVYAVKSDGTWKLSNALPRNTATWKHDTIKGFVYVYAPDYPFNRARADSAVAFADSLADVFNVPRIGSLTYYLHKDLDELNATLGLTSTVKLGPTGARAIPNNSMILSGMPAIGENYRHEIAHVVFRSLLTPATSTFISEGVPTWYGGTIGKTYTQSVRDLAVWLRAHPTVTLDSLMRPGFSQEQTYPAAAVVVDIVSDQIGRHGIRLLFDAGASASELREGLQRITKFGWARLSQEWYDRVMDQAPPGH
ncbi:MAG: hypothetical protein ACO1Q7_09350 [Gemmatimonas sp.]